MTPDQIKQLAKRAGGTQPYTDLALITFDPDALAEFVRLVRESVLDDAVLVCDGEKWCDTGKKSVDYIQAFNEGCDDCISVIGRMK